MEYETRVGGGGDDAPLYFADLAKDPASPRRGGRPLHVSAYHRWASKGLNGIRLRTVKAGGARASTRAWLRQFFDALAAAEATRTDRVDPDDDRLDRELDELGV